MAEPARSWKQRVLGVVRVVAILYACLIVAGLVLPGMMIYHPPSRWPAAPMTERIGGQEGEVHMRLLPPAGPDQPLVMFFHGNAETVAHLEPYLQRYHQLGVGICAVEYPGYADCPGQPNEDSLYTAARMAYAFLVESHDIAPERIIVHGRSLGGGPATYLAANRKVGGLILESSFTSAFRVMTRWTLLPWDQFPSASRLWQIEAPVLVLHGARDQIIPVWHGRELAAIAGVEPIIEPTAGHNNLLYRMGDRYWQALETFIHKR